jgi:signal transduction histidine kinase
MQTMNLRNAVHARIDRRLWVAYGLLWLLLWSLMYLSHLQTDLTKGNWRPWQAFYNASITLWPAMLLGTLPWFYNWFKLNGATSLLRHCLLAIVFSLGWLALNTATGYVAYGFEYCEATFRETFLWQTLWGFIVFAGLVAALKALLTARESKLNAVAAVQAESARVRAELSAIRGKLNPHFLFNTLNTLVALTRKDAKQAERALLQFSGMLRYVLDSQREQRDRVLLRDEIEFARDYLSLEQLRLGQRLRVQWQIDEACLDLEIPILTLQPLIENSIIHAVAPQLAGGTITISAGQHSGQLILEVRDDGPGVDLAQIGNGHRKGIGLSALKQRFELDYEGQASFELASAPGQGFSVTITLPI